MKDFHTRKYFWHGSPSHLKYKIWLGIHTQLQDELASDVSHVVCVNFMDVWQDPQFNGDSEW